MGLPPERGFDEYTSHDETVNGGVAIHSSVAMLNNAVISLSPSKNQKPGKLLSFT
jgi:hypothetical protein